MLALAMMLSVAMTQTTEPPVGAKVPRFSIRIMATDNKWSATHQCKVLAIVSSSAAISVDALPTLLLRRRGVVDPIEKMREEYWASFDFNSGAPLRVNDRSRVVLKEGSDSSSEISACDLRWARAIHSSWPAYNLRDTVPVGEYDLVFEMQITDRTVKQRLRSEGIPISIR